MSMKPPVYKMRVYKKYNVWWVECPSCDDYGTYYLTFERAIKKVALYYTKHKKCQKKLT